MEDADVVIIGAGIFGLTCASTYQRSDPTAKIIILESSPSIGGTWGAHRIFPGLRTNNLLGMYEHPDFPMDTNRYGLKVGEHIPAEKMFEYLEAFVKWSGIRDCIRLNTVVETIERDGTQWILQCVGGDKQTPGAIHAGKLILASGNTNKPYMPAYSRSPNFEPIILHSKDFPKHFDGLAASTRHTLVIGSGKSAWDVSHACATQADSTVTMLIRPCGNGPIWMPPSHVTPFSLWLEKLIFTRFFGFMSPCPWAKSTGVEGWLRSFFHGTWLGRKVAEVFWQVLGNDVHELNKLNEHPETKKLRPWTDAFEVGNALSIHNYPTSFFELVRQGRIKVLVDEVAKLDKGRKVSLESGASLTVDAVICATGWQTGNTIQFKPEGLIKELGLPSPRPDPADESLIAQTEHQLYKQFPPLQRDTSRIHHPDPALRSTPGSESNKQQPYRLYHFIAPPALLQDRNVAFAGALNILGTFPCAYIQSLWITAYLNGTLRLPDAAAEDIKAETYRDTQYCVLRHTFGYGRVLPDLVWDSLPYFDVLMKDLGLEARRKGGLTGLRECVKSYGPEDYKGLVDEWLKTHGKGEDKKDI